MSTYTTLSPGRVELVCQGCSKSFIVKRADAPLRKNCSIACRNKSSDYKEMLIRAGKKSASRDTSGDKNPNWRGGVSSQRHLVMSQKAYKDWRKSVYERDMYKCVNCGVPGNGKNLNADHIEPYILRPDLVFELSNGRTLCIDCHKNTDTYGWKLFNRLRKEHIAWQK